MRSAIHSLLAVLHFWTFFLCPSLQAGQEKYRIEVSVFEDDNKIPQKQRTSFAPLTFAEINDAKGYHLNLFISRPHEEEETEENPWKFWSHGAVLKPSFNGYKYETHHAFNRVVSNYDEHLTFSFSFLEEGKLKLTLPENFKDKIEVISPFSVITHIIDRKRFYPPFGEDDWLSTESPKLLHTFEFLSPLSYDIKGVMPFRTLSFQQKDFENNPRGWMIGGAETNTPWKKIKWEASGVVENTARFLSQKVNVQTQGLINRGELLADGLTKVETTFLDNQNGEIKGKSKTQVIIQNHLHNRDGVIGSGKGETHLALSPAFNQTNEGHELGKIKGHKLHVHGNGFQGLLHHGRLVSNNEIHLLNSSPFILKDVDVYTDLLTLNVPEFQSDKSPAAQKTRFLVGDYETLRFTTPYITEGAIEFWEKGFDSVHLIKEMLQKRPHVLEPRDTAGKTIQIFAPLKAAKISAYAPNYKLHAKHGCIGDAALDVKDGDFRAYVRSFDLEDGLGVAKNADIIAPNGIRIGDLVVDPNTNCLREFYPDLDKYPFNNSIYWWGSWVDSSFYLILDGKKYQTPKRYPFTNEGGDKGKIVQNRRQNSSSWYQWICLPSFLSNKATFYTKCHTNFQGPLDLRGILDAYDFTLRSNIASTATLGTLKIQGEMILHKKTCFYLKPPVTDMYGYCEWTTFQGLHYRSPNHLIVRGFKCGEASNCYIGGKLQTHDTAKLINIGSQLFIHDISNGACFENISFYTHGILPSPVVNSIIVEPSLKESFEKNPFFTHLQDPSLSFVGNQCKEKCTLNQKCVFIHSYPYSVCSLSYFVPLWSQNHTFPYQFSTSTNYTTSPSLKQLQGSLTTPILFVQYSGDIVLGESHSCKPTPKPQSVSLMEMGLNGYLVQYNDRPIQIETHSLSSTPFQFMFRPKFWYDDKQTQSFYKDILDYAFVVSKDGFEKLKPGSLLSLTPDLLIENVRKACQKTLNRSYLEISLNPEENKITEKVVRQLHLNMFEYLKTQGENALLWQDLEHPVLYYTGLQNQFGQREFSPHIRFPQKMIDQANGKQGGTNIVGNFMAVLPEGMTLQDFLAICQMSPAVLKYVSNLLETTPRVAHSMLKALESVKSAPVSQDIVPVNSSSTLVRTSPENNLTIHGNVNMETAVAISKNDLIIDGDIKGINGLFAALRDLWIKSLKERRSFHENGWHGFKDVLTVKAAINMIRTLTLASGRHTTTVGAHTSGGESQPINTGGQFRPQPLILEMEATRRTSGDDWECEEHKSSSKPVPSSHYGYHLPITTGEGVNGNGVVLGGNTTVIIAENNDIQLKPAIKTDSYSSHTTSTDDGIFSSSTDHHYHNSFTSTSIPSTLNFPGGVHAITNGKEDKLELEHTNFNTVQGTIAESYNVSITPGTERREIHNLSISSDFFYTTTEGNDTRIVTHPFGIITGPFMVRTPSGNTSTKPRVSITTVAGEETPEYLKALRLLKNIELQESTICNEHYYNSFSHSQLNPQFCTLISLGVSAMMPGVGSGLTAALFKAVVNPMITNSIISLANTGNLQQAFSRNSLRSYASSFLATALIGNASPPDSANFFDQGVFYLTQNIARNTIQAGLTTTIERRGKFGDNFVEGLKSAAIETGSTVTTRGLGGMVHSVEGLNPFLQYGGHFLIGATTAKLSGKDPIVGGLGAMAGEFAGELFLDWVKNSNSQEQLLARKEKAIEITQFIIGLGAFLSGQKAQDIQMAAQTGGTAMRHNSFSFPKFTYEQEKRRQEQLEKVGEILEETENALLDLYLDFKYNPGRQAKIFDARRYGNEPIFQKTQSKSRYLGSTLFDYYIPDFCRYMGSGVAYNVDTALSLFNAPPVVSHYMGDAFSSTGNVAAYFLGDPLTYVPIGGVIGTGFGKIGTLTSNFLSKFETYHVVKEFTIQSLRGLKKPFMMFNSRNAEYGKIPTEFISHVEPYFAPGTLGAAKPWTTKSRLKTAQLPTQGKIRFVPRKNYNAQMPLRRGPNNGFLDRLDNEWVKGPSRTKGEAFEWDVILSRKGQEKLGWLSRDQKHINVSLDGKITHK